VAGTQPGTQVTLTVVRDNREQQLRATLGEFVPETAKADNEGEGGDAASHVETGKLGVGVEPVTAQLISQLRLPAGTQGLAVMQVDPSSPAAEAGINEGDVIEEVNRQPVRSVADLKAALQRTGTRPALLLINRGGNSIFLTVRPRQ
jgi:serine protease Do